MSGRHTNKKSAKHDVHLENTNERVHAFSRTMHWNMANHRQTNRRRRSCAIADGWLPPCINSVVVVQSWEKHLFDVNPHPPCPRSSLAESTTRRKKTTSNRFHPTTPVAASIPATIRVHYQVARTTDNVRCSQVTRLSSPMAKPRPRYWCQHYR